MLRTGTILLTMILLSSLIMSCVPTNNEVSGGLLPDFDLKIDESIMWINPDTGLGQGTITITNVAIDASIRVRLTVEAPGFQVSPQYATVTVGPASTKSIPLAAATILGSPARISSINVFGEITHINGVAANGIRERQTSVALINPRSHQLFPTTLNITVGRGETKVGSVTLDNMINSEDFIALEFINTDDQIRAYPQVYFKRFDPGSPMEYPIIVSASDSASKNIHTLRYRIYAMGGEDSLVEGEIGIQVVDADSTVEDSGVFSSGGLVAGSIYLIIMVAFLFIIARSPVSRARGSSIAPIVGMILLLTLLLPFLSPPVSGFNGAVSYDGSGDLDPNPLTSDEMAVASRWITLESTDANEQFVEIFVNAGELIPSYNNFQRVPAGSSTSFQVYVIVPKGSPPGAHDVEVIAHTVEREGLPVEDSGSVSGMFRVDSLAYSMPLIEPLDEPFLVGGKGDGSTFSFRVTNGGNNADGLSIVGEVSDSEGEDPPIEFELSPGGSDDIEVGGQYIEEVDVRITGELGFPRIVRISAIGNVTDKPGTYANILVIPEPEDDESIVESTEFMAGSAILIIVVLIVLVFIVMKRKGSVDEDDEGDDGAGDYDEGGDDEGDDGGNDGGNDEEGVMWE